MILDQYVFDVDELVQYALHSPDNLYKNPHENAGDFSEIAKQKIREHPMLSQPAAQLDMKLEQQRSTVGAKTVEEVKKMLLLINKKGIHTESDPRIEFINHVATLSPEQQHQLNDFVITISMQPKGLRPSRSTISAEASFALMHKDNSAVNRHDTRIMTFSEALQGGSAATPCVKTLQIFLWKFVLDFEPAASELIPDQVKQDALKQGYQLGSSLSSSPGKNARPSSLSSLDVLTEDPEERNASDASPKKGPGF